MVLLALDDTDTRAGGCTTHTAYRIACAIEHAGGVLAGWGLAEPARLVRLDPAAPDRTRGNGALVLPLGYGSADPERVIGSHPDGRPLVARKGAAPWPDGPARAALTALVAALLPGPGDAGADPQPGAVLLPEAPDPRLYRAAVSGLVGHAEAWAAAPRGTVRLGDGPRRGEIGALAAAAWSPRTEGAWTWEAIAYRAEDERAAGRRLPADFGAFVGAIRGAFDNLDPATGRLRCVPRTPCPVRFGVRGLDPDALQGLVAGGGGAGGWVVRTNHATGDHARHARRAPEPFAVVRFPVEVRAVPVRGRGGHLFVDADGPTGPLRLAAFEPTKAFRDAVGLVRPGDRLVVLGRTAADPRTVHLEAFLVDAVAPRRRAGANPRCVGCGVAMKSVGADAGFRCRGCRARLPASARSGVVDAPPFAPGDRFQVPDAVRGHLLPPASGLPLAVGWLEGPSRPIAPAFGLERAVVFA